MIPQYAEQQLINNLDLWKKMIIRTSLYLGFTFGTIGGISTRAEAIPLGSVDVLTDNNLQKFHLVGRYNAVNTVDSFCLFTAADDKLLGGNGNAQFIAFGCHDGKIGGQVSLNALTLLGIQSDVVLAPYLHVETGLSAKGVFVSLPLSRDSKGNPLIKLNGFVESDRTNGGATDTVVRIEIMAFPRR
jgi:hypothetical protein